MMRTGVLAALLAWLFVSGVAPATAASDKTNSPGADAKTEDKTPALLPGDAENYTLCLDTARTYPEQGLEFAGRWEGLGGGDPARHCAAVALIGLRHYAEAASRLEDLAQNGHERSEIRAGMLAQAAQAWFLNGNSDRAMAVQTAALTLAVPATRQYISLLIDRAMSEADLSKYDAAVNDLTSALQADPNNAEALAYRANAYRKLDRLEPAMADAQRAVALDKTNVSAFLERGTLYQLTGHDNEARQDWLQVVLLAPDSEAARAARASIEKLDVNTGGEGATPQE
jgi:tetratricopeptide (TPR) repeat protein